MHDGAFSVAAQEGMLLEDLQKVQQFAKSAAK